MNPIKKISNNESAQNHICPVTGLPIFRRPEWSDIDIAENYSVSFSLIGNAILCTVPNGILSNKGTRRLLEERKKVLKEVNLWDKRYAEIRDYSMIKGKPSQESRMMFANIVLKEANEGRLIGFWGFNAPLLIKWMFNVGVKLKKPSVPVAAVKDYREAVEHAVNVLMQNEINIGTRQYKMFTKEDWSVELDNFGVRFELIGNDVLYSVAHGSLREDYVEKFFKLHEKVLDEAGLKEKGYFYRILNWEKLEKTTWRARRMYIDGIKDLNKKVPCRLSVGFGLNKFMRAIIRVSKQFVPFPVALTNNLEAALTIIGREKQKETKTKIVKKGKSLLGKTSVEDQIRNYSDELLQFIGAINWDHTGISAEDVRNSHPFKLVFDAIAIIKEDVDGLFQERKQAEETLRENEEKYRTILENIEDGYFEVDIAGNFTFFNDSLVKILGYSKDELIGMNNWQYTDKENAKKLYETFNRVYKTGEPAKAFNWEVISKDGSKRYVEVSVSLMRDSESRPIGFRGIARDSTERKLAEKERAKLESQLLQAQKMETIGILAGGVAHDLNNVLSGIVSYPELLLMDIPEDSPLRKPVLTIKKSGEKAAVIVQDLLTLARRGVAITEVLTLNDIISDYLKSPEHEKLKGFHPNVKFEMDFEKELLNILGSSVHLYKTIMNLTSNAAEAVPSGGKIFISTKNRYIDRPIKGYDDINEGDYVILAISDNGVGMTPMDMERVFEPFYTKKVMGRSGTGLGMAVVWGVVNDHNGYIDVQSREGKGTTFTLYFPVTRKDIAKDESILSLEDYMGKGESILVVDDVEEQGEIATGVLRKLGYSVTSVSSGEEAVEYMKNNSADLMVLDMIMDPGINGRETYERIINIHPNQKAVIASGFSETDDAKAALKLGAGQYIKKPYTLEKIGLAVRDELRK
ncbi:MAG: PAS domain S-box protein [Desulfobacterales bacterium]|nr:PAS domain S-box protein [Desulfobacterales bacterium]